MGVADKGYVMDVPRTSRTCVLCPPTFIWPLQPFISFLTHGNAFFRAAYKHTMSRQSQVANAAVVV